MTENIEHLILEQFRALRNQIAGLQTEMRSEFSEVKHRLNRIETSVDGVRRAMQLDRRKTSRFRRR